MPSTTYYMTIDGGYSDLADEMKLIARQGITVVSSTETVSVNEVGGSYVASATLDYDISDEGPVELILFLTSASKVVIWTGMDDLSAGEGEGGILTTGEIVAAINADATQQTLQANASTAATEVQKVPRSASALTAGGDSTRTKQSATNSTLVERIS